ncbi:hypothetical protein C2W62_15765 [Candidatus Entotheonella serta]|nr:hypothetical protein C2W62_15765 [Candidatus Entotheonella serta]
MDGAAIDLSAVTADGITTAGEVGHSDVLIAFADAIVAADEHALQHTRHGVLEVMGPEAMVDAAGVASNFERMVRIADATGIPLDDRMAKASQDVREELELERFAAFKEQD